MPKSICLFALLFLASSLTAKEKATLSKLVANAQYVFVTTYSGDETADPRMMPADRKVQADVEDALRKWGRFTVVHDRSAAELIILVRTGRVGEAVEGVHVHHGSERSPSPGTTVGRTSGVDASAGTNVKEDTLELYDAKTGLDAAPLWRGIEDQGLNPPRMHLVEELRRKVETKAKHP